MKVLKMNLLKNFKYRDSAGIIIEPTSGTSGVLNNFPPVRFRVVCTRRASGNLFRSLSPPSSSFSPLP